MKFVFRLISILNTLLFFYSESFSQYSDSLHLEIGSTFTYSTRVYQPHWIVSNRWGTIADRQTDLSTYISFRHQHNWYFSKDTTTNSICPDILVDYGGSLYNNQHFTNTFLEQVYIKVAYKKLVLVGGRYEEAVGELNHELSSGSLAQSRNALPFPQIALSTLGFVNIPFTYKWLQFKGRLAHGWLGENRIVKNSYVHSKTMLLRVGRKKWFFHAGLHHLAVWGGYHTVRDTQLPSKTKDFFTVLTSQSGNDPNKEGSHIGVYDFGVTISSEKWDVRLYNQSPFEDGSGNLPLFKPDRLLGFNWTLPSKRNIVNELTLEYIYTLYQSGDKPDPGRDNFYNNGLYRTGWNYKDRIIGTPLFFNVSRAKYYLQEPILSSGTWNVINSRVKGAHIGIKGSIARNFHYRTLITYTINYGNHRNNRQFTPEIKQFYSLQEFNLNINKYSIKAGIGADLGGFGNTAGCTLGLSYNFDW